jgi:hypothetical protein
MELQEALSQLSEIRTRIASAETFRGYRSVTVAFTGCLAVLGAIAQPICVPDPRAHFATYLTLWIGIAAISVGATASEMILRCLRMQSTSQSRLTRLAAAQFLPCVLVGALVTATLAVHASETLWMLPGLWSLFFSLGVFSSARLLPRAVFWVAGWYLVAGLFCLAFARESAALSPWTMGLTFGGGQLLAAAILYMTLERNR